MKSGKAFLDHLLPDEGEDVHDQTFILDNCELCVHITFGIGSISTRKYARPLKITGPEPIWNEAFQWEVPLSQDEIERAESFDVHMVFYRHYHKDKHIEII